MILEDWEYVAIDDNMYVKRQIYILYVYFCIHDIFNPALFCYVLREVPFNLNSVKCGPCKVTCLKPVLCDV